jgi:hypothetical protein
MNSVNETFRKQQNAFLMLKLMEQGETDSQNGRVTPQAKVFDGLRTSLLKRHWEQNSTQR